MMVIPFSVLVISLKVVFGLALGVAYFRFFGMLNDGVTGGILNNNNQRGR